jgi:hypothetical protein
MRLIHEKTGQPVTIGETVTDFRGDTATVTGWQEPHKPESTGRINVRLPQADSDCQYYPGVFGCIWQQGPRTFEVSGNYGTMIVNYDTGEVLEYQPDCDWNPEKPEEGYGDIICIDVQEVQAVNLANFAPPYTPFDILDVGFWTKNGTYEPRTRNPLTGADEDNPDVYVLGDQPFTCPKCGLRTFSVGDNLQRCSQHGTFRTENPKPDDMYWFSTGSGRIELKLSLEDAQSGSHSGRCDEDIAALRKVPYIAAQLAEIDSTLLAAELKEYGAWDAAELADHDANLNRILWSACCDIREENS